MPRMKLTKSAIDSLPTPGSDVVYWDINVPGFGVIDDGKMIQQCSKARLLRREGNGDAHGVAPNQRHTTESDFPQAENRR